MQRFIYLPKSRGQNPMLHILFFLTGGRIYYPSNCRAFLTLSHMLLVYINLSSFFFGYLMSGVRMSKSLFQSLQSKLILRLIGSIKVDRLIIMFCFVNFQPNYNKDLCVLVKSSILEYICITNLMSLLFFIKSLEAHEIHKQVVILSCSYINFSYPNNVKRTSSKDYGGCDQ